ncbi:hypothetical protein JB92DRAFT_2902819, partial [Gautieria morchelliformis]
MFSLEAGPLFATTTNIVYFCRPLIKCTKIIAGTLRCRAIGCEWRRSLPAQWHL